MNLKSLLLICFVLIGSISFAQKSKKGKKAESTQMTELDTISYSLGLGYAKQLKAQGFDQVNPEMFAQGLSDMLAGGEMKITEADAENIQRAFLQKLQMMKTEKAQAAGKEYLAANKSKEGVVETASGLQYKILTPGDGDKPAATDKVRVHYHGTLLDGTVFDSSVERGQPAEFPLNRVIPGWTEGVQLMPKGSKFRFFIPSDLAYGARGAGAKIGPHSTLIFDVELLDILK